MCDIEKSWLQSAYMLFFSSRYLEAPVGHYIGMNFTAFNLGPAAPNCTGQDALSVFNRDRFGMSIFAK